MNSKCEGYTPVDEYWAYDLPELKRRLLSEFETDFDRTLKSHSGDRMFLSFVAMRFKAMLRGAAIRADVSERFQNLASDSELEHWARMPSWSSGETAALFCGLNPDRIRDVEGEIGKLADNNELARRFEEIRAILGRGGWYSLQPSDAIAWAEQFDLNVPEHLRASVRKMWSSKASAPQTEGLHTRTKNNLLRVIAGLAKEARIDIDGPKAASQIEAAVSTAGFDGPKEKTVREILAEVRGLD